MGTHGVKIVLIYPRPQDEQAFETAYTEQHVPLIEQKLKGITRLVLTKVIGSPQGKVSAYRMSEVYFSSMDELNACIQSDAGKQVIAHAQAISSGGAPLILICEEEAFVYW
ncbi:MAG: EthD family reductase [Bryobacteraceae bacterium]|jgi:uncharacterized protein (TIGR02118 family)